MYTMSRRLHPFQLRRFCASRKDVRVRFAPSPTGSLHLGSLRTALYNYLFAKSRNGSFLLRIEDTDQARLVPESIDQIHSVLDFYGLNVDEGPRCPGKHGPYLQSERLSLYEEKVHQLIETGHAYRCFCSESRLSLLRKDALRNNSIPKYDRKCRSIDPDESRRRSDAGEMHVVRFKLDNQNVSFKDEVFGDVTQALDESDMIILKSDGFPTYHLANVVDDRDMEISHVIRGMEWLSSTGKHMLLYRAFGWNTPSWVHLSLITRDGKKKLSKRDKDAFVDYYDKELGALPDAVLNLLIRNGSGIRNFDSSRLYKLQDMVNDFDVSTIGKRNLQLDTESLDSYGCKAFQASDASFLATKINQRLPSAIDSSYLEKVVDFLKTNEEKFAHLSSLTDGDFKWMLSSNVTSEGLLTKFDVQQARIILDGILRNDAYHMDAIKTLSAELGLPYTKLLMALRLCLINSHKGPPISELVDFFGLEECKHRLQLILDTLDKQQSC